MVEEARILRLRPQNDNPRVFFRKPYYRHHVGADPRVRTMSFSRKGSAPYTDSGGSWRLQERPIERPYSSAAAYPRDHYAELVIADVRDGRRHTQACPYNGPDHHAMRVELVLLDDPAIHVSGVAQDLLGTEEDADLPLGRLRTVGAVDHVTAQVEREVTADRAGG